MTSPTQPKPTPIPAVLVYGTPTSPDLTQASWFRAEDKQAAKAAAETLKFSVIDIQTEAEKALTVGVHEGVLKGSGRMIVGSVSSEVYRRIEDYVRKAAGAEASPRPANTETAAAKPASEQTMNTWHYGSRRDRFRASPLKNRRSEPRPTSKPRQRSELRRIADPASPTRSPPPPDPWDALRVGSHVVAKYWETDGEPMVGGWRSSPASKKTTSLSVGPTNHKTPPLKIERKHVAILHPAFDVDDGMGTKRR